MKASEAIYRHKPENKEIATPLSRPAMAGKMTFGWMQVT
jgi:hypothetical protein